LKPSNQQATTNYQHRQIHLTQQQPKSDRVKEKMQKFVNFDEIHKNCPDITIFTVFFAKKHISLSVFAKCKIITISFHWSQSEV
jgi:hypothetical protein